MGGLLLIEEKSEYYNNMFHGIIQALCKEHEKNLNLMLVDDSEKFDIKSQDSTLTEENYSWTREIIYNEYKLCIKIYAENPQQFNERMGDSLFLNLQYPVFNCLIVRILDKMEEIVIHDLATNQLQMTYIENKEALLLQAVTDFFIQEKLPNVNTITYLSSLTYEKGLCGGNIIFTSKESFYMNNSTLFFEKELKFNLDNYRIIRKLLETVREDGYLLVDIKNKNIVGIAYDIHPDRDERVSYYLHFLGHMHWILKKKYEIAVEYKDGRYYITDDFSKKQNFNLLQEKCRGMCNVEDIEKIIDIAKEQSHGTLLIFSSCAENESKRLCDINRGLKIDQYPVLANHTMLKSVTSIDGAVMLDEKCECHAIGVILDGPAKKGDISRGARYNSALTYVNWLRQSSDNWIVGVVISEDGMVNII